MKPRAWHAELEAQRQTVLNLQRALEERDEELATACESNRRLMNQLYRSGAWREQVAELARRAGRDQAAVEAALALPASAGARHLSA